MWGSKFLLFKPPNMWRSFSCDEHKNLEPYDTVKILRELIVDAVVYIANFKQYNL